MSTRQSSASISMRTPAASNKTPAGRRRKRTNKENNDNAVTTVNKEPDYKIMDDSSSQLDQDLKQLLVRAAKRIGLEPRDVEWMDVPILAQASQHLSKATTTFAFAEYATSMTSFARKAIKECTSTPSAPIQVKVSLLHAATILLRAIASECKKELALKSTYHCLSISSELLREGQKKDDDCPHACLLCWIIASSWDLLVHLLADYRLWTADDKSLRIQRLADNSSSSSFILQCISLKESSKTPPESALPLHQVATMFFAGVLGISTVLKYLTVQSLLGDPRHKLEGSKVGLLPAFGSWTRTLIESSSKGGSLEDFTSVLTKLVQESVLSWIQYCRRDKLARNHIQGHAKTIHWTLWDAANQFKASRKAACVVLQLRTWALIAQAQAGDDNDGLWASASKIAAHYVQQQQQANHTGGIAALPVSWKEEPLQDFYRDLKTYFPSLHDIISVGQAEFLVLRALYTGKSSIGVVQHPLLQVGMMLVEARCHVAGKNVAWGANWDDIGETSNQVAQVFQATDARNSLSKLIGQIGLVPSINQVLKTGETEMPSSKGIEKAIVALLNVLAPFYRHCLADGLEAPPVPVSHAQDMLVECITRAVLLLDRTNQSDRGQNLLRSLATELSTRMSLLPESIERAGKRLALVAQQAQNSETGCLANLLSLQCFMRLDPIILEEHQIEARWSHAASALEACGKPLEAVLVLLGACFLPSKEPTPSNADVSEQYARYSKDLLPPCDSCLVSKAQRSWIRKAVKLLLLLLEGQQEVPQLSSTLSPSMLIGDLLCSERVPGHTQEIVTNVLAMLSQGNENTTIMSGWILLEFLYQLSVRVDETGVHMLDSSAFALALYQQVAKLNPCAGDAIHESLFQLCSVAMLTNLNREASDSVARARKALFEDSRALWDKEGTDAYLLFAVLETRIYGVDDTLCGGKTLSRIEACIRNRKAIAKTSMWAISELCKGFLDIGDVESFRCISNLLLSSTDGTEPQLTAWIQHTLTLLELSHIFENFVDPEQKERSEWKAALGDGFMDRLFQIEYAVASIRLEAKHGTNIEVQEANIEVLRSRLNELPPPDDEEGRTLFFWCLSSLEMAACDLFAISGKTLEAVGALQACRKYCHQADASSKRQNSSGRHPFWLSMVLQSIPPMLSCRQLECLFRLAFFKSQMGDFRGAQAYALRLARSVCPWMDEEFERLKLDEIIRHLRCARKEREKTCLRVLTEVEGTSTSLDLLPSPTSKYMADGSETPRFDNMSGTRSANASDLIAIGDLLYGEGIVLPNSDFSKYYRKAREGLRDLEEAEQVRPITTLGQTVLKNHLALRRVRCILSSTDQTSDEALQLCLGLLEAEGMDVSSRAWAHFYAGSIYISRARVNGALHQLWSQHSNVPPDLQRSASTSSDETLVNARKHLSRAFRSLGSCSDSFARKVLRMLALCNGPLSAFDEHNTSYLVLSSIGRLTRQQMVSLLVSSITNQDDIQFWKAFDEHWEDPSTRQDRIFSFLDELVSLSPFGWRFIHMAICPSGEILCTSFEKSSDPSSSFSIQTVCIFPQEGQTSMYDSVVKALDTIVEDNQSHLAGMAKTSDGTVSQQYSKEDAKRDWWNQRKNQDSELHRLLCSIDESMFSNATVLNAVFGGQSAPESPKLSRYNLAARFDAAADDQTSQSSSSATDSVGLSKDDVRAQYQKMTVAQLRSELSELGARKSSYSKLRKAELIDLLMDRIDETGPHSPPEFDRIPSDSTCNTQCSERCTFLILDENLHRFPFEGMPSFRNHTVCRVPSLAFVFAALISRDQEERKSGRSETAIHEASFVLDPENNLSGTSARLLPVIKEIQSSERYSWEGVVKRIPNESFFEAGLRKSKGLFLYFGHGGGQVCFPRRMVESLISDESSSDIRSCRSTVVLMGCSSGRLVSVNRKHSRTLEELPLYYDPEGIALAYLMAGAPCVVGNLWDVTDHDIDRYSMSLLKSFCSRDNTSSLAQCVAESREACKMRYIVGCAPVCYGLPVYPAKK